MAFMCTMYLVFGEEMMWMYILAAVASECTVCLYMPSIYPEDVMS